MANLRLLIHQKLDDGVNNWSLVVRAISKVEIYRWLQI